MESHDYRLNEFVQKDGRIVTKRDGKESTFLEWETLMDLITQRLDMLHSGLTSRHMVLVELFTK